MKRIVVFAVTMTLTLGLLGSISSAWAATAAFSGKVTAVKTAAAKQKDPLTHVSLALDFFGIILRALTADFLLRKIGFASAPPGRVAMPTRPHLVLARIAP